MKLSNKIQWLFLIAFVLSMFYIPIFCFLLLGCYILFYVIKYFHFLNEINKNGIETTGKILFYENENGGYKSPLIEFEINGNKVNQKPFFYASTDLSKFRNYKSKIDKLIPIVYLKENPEKFILKSEKEFNYFSLVFMAIAATIFIIISLAHLFNFIKIDGMN